MGTIVDATIPARDLALDETFGMFPEARFELVRVVAHGSGDVPPFLWTTGVGIDDLRRTLEDDSSVERAHQVAASEHGGLFRLEWTSSVRDALSTLVSENRALLAATAHDGQWKLRLMFPERASVSDIFRVWNTNGMNLAVECVYGSNGAFKNGSFDLTDQQYDALIAALDADYYEVPRGTTLEQLSENIGISHQALSERLRRGHKNIVKNTLHNGPHGPQPLASDRQ